MVRARLEIVKKRKERKTRRKKREKNQSLYERLWKRKEQKEAWVGRRS